MLLDEFGDAIVDVVPGLVGDDRAPLGTGNLDGQIHLPAVTHVDDASTAIGSGEKSGHFPDRLLGRREADSLKRASGEVLQPLQRETQVSAPLVPGQGVNLVDDHGSGLLQHGSSATGSEQDEEGLGSRDQDVRRSSGHSGAFPGQGVSGPDQRLYGGQLQAPGIPQLLNLLQGLQQVHTDVVGQGLQRRDVHDLGALGEFLAGTLADEPVDGAKKGGQRLPGAGGGGDEDVLAPLNGRPPETLRLGRLAEPVSEPLLHHRLKLDH